MKLTVIYRACGSEMKQIKPERPSWFNKLNCWINFYHTFKDKDTEIRFVYDGDESFLSDLVLEKYKDVKFHTLMEKDNKGSLLFCYQLASNLDSDAFYFVEDDYLHAPDAARILKEGVFNLDLVTLYDHPDRYIAPTTDISFGHETILAGEYCHWRTAESTTCTVAMKKSFFEYIKNDLIHYCKSGVNAPNDREFYRFIYKEKKRRLWTPMPGRSTHCISNLLSPYQAWDDINRQTMKSS